MSAKEQKHTRLQRLLGLLETGSSEATRKAAARQITDICRSHPQQLPSVVRKVHSLLLHKSWETRTAAGEALGLLADAFPHATVTDLAAAAGVQQRAAEASQPQQNAGGEALQVSALEAFHLQTILDRGTALLASGGKEFELSPEDMALTPQQRLEKQRQQLKARLGLDKGVGAMVMDAGDLINDEDLDVDMTSAATSGGGKGGRGGTAAPKQQAAELLLNMEGLSARERNRLKRKAKAMGRSESLQAPGTSGRSAKPGVSAGKGGGKSSGAAGGNNSESAGGGQQRSGSEGGGLVSSTAEAAENDEAEWAAILAGGWPFQRVCDQLSVDVLDPSWEVRHGAAVGLREVLRSHAGSACVDAPMADEGTSGWAMPGGSGKRQLGLVTSEASASAAASNRVWLEDVSVLLLCVLALDRFADYGADQVTAPVRETAAQALGVSMAAMDLATVKRVMSLLEQLQKQPEWDVRYGGYLGLKYLLAARVDDRRELLPLALPILTAGLQDMDDDVRAASADALSPMAVELHALGSGTAASLQSLLWDMLGTLDELSPATGPALTLLSLLYAHASSGVSLAQAGQLSKLAPRLYPFMRHSLSGVRTSVLSCLDRLLSGSQSNSSSAASPAAPAPVAWLQPLLPSLLRLLFQQLVIEQEPRVQQAALKVWALTLRCSDPAALAAALSQHIAPPASRPATGGNGVHPFSPPTLMETFLALASTADGQALDRALLVVVAGDGQMVSAADLPHYPGGAQQQQAAGAGVSTGAPAPAKRARQRGPAANGAGAAAGAGDTATSSPSPAAASGRAGALYMANISVGAGGEGSGARMRLLAAQALGLLARAVTPFQAGQVTHGTLHTSLASPSATARITAAHALWHSLKPLGSDGASQELEHSMAVSPTILSGSTTATASTGGTTTSTITVPAAPAVEMTPALQAVLLQHLGSTSCSYPSAPASLLPYGETGPFYAQMRREMLSLINACMQAGYLLHTPGNVPVDSLTPDQALTMITQVSSLPGAEDTASPDSSPLAAAKQRAQGVASSLQTYEQYLHMTVLAACATTTVRTAALPPKLNSIIQPLMAAARKEPEAALQEVCARALAELLLLCSSRTPSPNDKLLRNICAMAWGDAAVTPSAAATAASDAASAAASSAQALEQQLQERLASHAGAGPRAGGGKASSAAGGAGVGDESTLAAADAAAAAGAAAAAAKAAPSPAAMAAKVARLGAEAALRAVCAVCGPALWTTLPTLWDVVSTPVTALAAALEAEQQPGEKAPLPPGVSEGMGGWPADQLQGVVNAMRILEVVGPSLHPELSSSLAPLVTPLLGCCTCANSAVRESASKALAALASAWAPVLMPPLLRTLVPMLSSPISRTRLGAVCVTAALVSTLGARLVSYAVLLVVPLLRRMSDSDGDVRARASACFGALVALLPLAQGQPLPPGLDSEQLQAAAQDSTFLMQLLDNRQAEDYPLPMAVAVPLRRYQQEGINWLHFLRHFGLHGILADDMGLGKTLQASCIMAAALADQEKELQSTNVRPLPCIVVCPSTLVQHWAYEVHKYVPPANIRPFAYGGNPAERAAQQKQLDAALSGKAKAKDPPNLVVISYDNLRTDIEWVSKHSWLYAVLDEGHVIRSAKTRVAQACRRITAQHRLILSGTPIQNSVLELWALFDFLMPGFLGPERDFNARYGKALQAARYSKKGSSEAEAGLLAVDALHKQVMPFVLRRTKAQVLSDLPPKIIQDIYCDLSPLQKALYEDFQGSQVSGEAAAALQKAASSEGGLEEGAGGAVHVFQALQYMRKLCSHPSLVLNLQQPAHRKAASRVLGSSAAGDAKAAAAALRDISHSPKLLALRDLLAQCGVISGLGGEGGDNISSSSSGESGDSDGALGSGHRLLVFAQLKGMLDLVEQDLLTPLGVSYLRLDGSVDANQRFAIVQRFNSDPTIDVLLLTTQAGGLGLNLTSADTVVFLEHDWNPMKDMQAMDRAHRLGQTRTVNVYRLLMRGTLEERIMGLQQFKLDVANTVVNQENMSLETMDTGKLLDLFGGQAAAGAQAAGGAAVKAGKATGLQAMLASMGEMWDEKEYEAEFSMQTFMNKLGKGQQQQ